MEPADSCNTLSNRPQGGRTEAKKLATLLFLWRTKIEKNFCYGCKFPPTWGKFNILHHFFQNFLPIFLLVSKFKFIFAAGL
jgi:hypothetical protein